MTNWGPLAIIAALLGLGGMQEKLKTTGAGNGFRLPDELTPAVPITPSMTGPTLPSGTKFDVYKEPSITPLTGPKISESIGPAPTVTTRSYTQPVISPGVSPGVRVDVLVDRPTRLTEATLTNPSPTTATGTIVRKTSGWTWFTPQGPITSRDPTQEEKDSGLGCPEVPGIWTYPGISMQNVKYCANPDCPSNQRQYEAVTAEGPTWLEPTPAQLEQQVDAQGVISYFCRVCRTYQ